jgi:YVTN family beta-propeller protein
VSVGRRPSAIARLADGTLFVADTFSDSVSVIEPKSPKRATQISLGPQPKLSPPQSGEMLFYDSRLSHDGWMSCHSCHTDGHSNGQLNDNLSDGSFGESKRVLSLLGVSETGPWAWNGQVKTLEEQVTSSIKKNAGNSPAGERRFGIGCLLELVASASLASEVKRQGCGDTGQTRRSAVRHA